MIKDGCCRLLPSLIKGLLPKICFLHIGGVVAITWVLEAGHDVVSSTFHDVSHGSKALDHGVVLWLGLRKSSSNWL